MIEYKVNGPIDVDELKSFFQNWKSPPSAVTRRALLKGSDFVATARDQDKLVGFITAISDHAMHAFITLVEVLEPYQGQGIGKHLVELATDHYRGNYDIVLITDPDKGSFYKKVGFTEIYGMHIRDFTYGKIKKQP